MARGSSEKPRIVKHMGIWLCEGLGLRGWGLTPKGAWVSWVEWQERRDLKVIYGLGPFDREYQLIDKLLDKRGI